MRIIITGVAGFIGYHLAQACCEEGYTVFGVDNFLCGYEERIDSLRHFPNFTFFRGSAHDKEITTWMNSSTVIVHLAGLSALASNQENPYLSYTNNVAVTAGLIENARIHGVSHILFASTSAIYEHTTVFPTPETLNEKPDLLYSLGKLHAEDLFRSFYSVYGVPYTLFRFFNVYGSNQGSSRTHPPLLPYLISCFEKGEQPLLHSNGLQRRDYIHVDDVIELILLTIRNGPTNDVFNVCTGTTVSVEELVTMIQNEMDTTIQPMYRDASLLWEKSPILWNGEHTFPILRMKDEVDKYSCGNPEHTFKTLGWKAQISIEKGIKLLCNLKNKL